MKYVIVGFKTTQENSIYYNKTSDRDAFHKQVDLAIDKGAGFISLRFIKNESEAEQKKLPNEQQQQDKKYFCNNPECKKEITKDVVAWCLHKDEEGRTRFDGKVYCRECQEEK